MTKVTGIYFLAISILFYFLWLSEVIPSALQNTTPKSLAEVGLPTNPVHVIDLSVILPAIFITGILLLGKNVIGILFAPVMLSFFILMDITIGALVVVMKTKGLETDLSVTTIMSVLAVLSAGLLVVHFKNEVRAV
jgi:hypothetical protein